LQVQSYEENITRIIPLDHGASKRNYSWGRADANF